MAYSAFGNSVYYYGDPSLEQITDLKSQYGQPQVFADIYNNAVNTGTNFVDPEFPHNDSSIGDYGKLFDTADATMMQQVQQWKQNGWSGSATWIRISDLCTTQYKGQNTPCFSCGDIGSTIGRNDIEQGCTGDCWFLSSISDVAMLPKLIDNVVPDDNSTNDGGVYHFRFWYQGAWVDVVVDDYLPCVVLTYQTFTVGSNFYPNNGKAEFWPMLLEKAYAKLNGGYSNISSNIIMNALESLTGGFGIYISIDSNLPSDAYQEILKWLDKGCVVGAGTNAGGRGVVGGHAYSVTGVHVVTTTDGTQHNLLRCRNPWGNTEFTGDWSDQSPLWNDVSQTQKSAIGFLSKDEGEFWIGYNDFITYFSDINGCFYYDATVVSQPGSTYQFAQFNSSWSVTDNTAGGFGSPWQNPMFLVEISSANPTGLLAVGLQVQCKINEDLSQGDCIRVFPTGGATTFDENFFESNYGNEKFPSGKTEVAGNSSFSFSQFYGLKPGQYLVVPSSLEAGFEKKILVRIYNEGKAAATQVASN